MKILIFENEIRAHKKSFDDVNFLDFDNSLEINWLDKYQQISSTEYSLYDLIFIDIDLSTRSEKDGYSIIKELKQVHNFHKIVVMTGHDVEDELKQKGWTGIPILEKPIFLDDLKQVIQDHKSNA